MLKPGTYRLKHDVKNPHADRRQKHDWRAWPVWAENDEFLVSEYARDTDTLIDDFAGTLTPEQIEAIREKTRYTVIHLVGARYSHQSIGPGHEEQYDALEAALEPIAESHEALFTRLRVESLGGGAAGFARWLVESGRLTPRAFELLWNAFQADDESPAQGQRLTSAEICERCDEHGVTLTNPKLTCRHEAPVNTALATIGPVVSQEEAAQVWAGINAVDDDDVPPHAFESYNVPSKPELSDYCQHCAVHRMEHK